jgi:hypothetical protein
MSNKILNIVSVLEEGKLACIKDRKTLRLEYSENTINILKQYLEQVYSQARYIIYLTILKRVFTFIHHILHLIRLRLKMIISFHWQNYLT